jgi:ATP-binding protein involved in chromosome partitioning
MASITEDLVLDALRQVIDPDLHRDIVSLGFIKNLAIDGGRVSFHVELTTPACPVKDQLKAACEERVRALDGVTEVNVTMTAQVRNTTGHLPSNPIPGVKNVIAVASGKGGVGKSTVASNLAASLAHRGSTVGLLDADIYGPSAPIMFGLDSAPQIENEKLLPVEKYGVKIMSLGLLTDDRTPVVWRGPLVARMITQFLNDVVWGELEYLVIDLPPGTGDAQLTLAQQCPISGAVVVTTPQNVALEDVYRAVKMFAQVNVPILGIVENMSYFEAPDTGTRYPIFGSGGGQRMATEFDVPLLAELPIVADVATAGDAGRPISVSAPETAAGAAFLNLADQIASRLSTMAMTDQVKPVPIKFNLGK